jgi:putative DNA methylase
MDAKVEKKVIPFSLKDAPSVIERVWPAQKISVEAQKERKAGQGQTLTSLGSYWKGRKPIFLAEACLWGALLPATGDDAADLEILETLLGMTDGQIIDRVKAGPTLEQVKKYTRPEQRGEFIEQFSEDGETRERLRSLPRETRKSAAASIFARMPYAERVSALSRPEEASPSALIHTRLPIVNARLGTDATTISELVNQLGIMRFGHTPKVADTFCGGGSIPFAAARMGCDVYASDLNPIAAMLSWGALNVIGSTEGSRRKIQAAQERLAEQIDEKIIELGIEHDEQGNRAKAFLYCLETRCPQTGWRVPLLPTLIISKNKKTIVRLNPNRSQKCFDVEIDEYVSAAELKRAAIGTVQDGALTYELDGERFTTSIKSIRGDRKNSDGSNTSNLRAWTKDDICPAPDDIFQERLYCIQWITKDSLDKGRQETFFAAPTVLDLEREREVETLVQNRLSSWQASGFIPDMRIEPGDNTSQPIRERGWTYWHHLFPPRHLLVLGLIREKMEGAEACLDFCQMLNITSKLCRIDSTAEQGGAVKYAQVFYNQALNTLLNYGVRGALSILKSGSLHPPHFETSGHAIVATNEAKVVPADADLYITDPPYADAVNYEEITEYFIAWLRRDPPAPFDVWSWDSRRQLAIKGVGDEFRRNMIDAYEAMASHMPDNGMQIMMFTHQSASVWADMAQIFWGAGLQVMAAWYIATETTSDLKKGGYVQGTVILVLRKRSANESGYKDEIVQEVKAEVAEQIDTMVGLNQNLRGHGRIENLFEDADLQMAGYAAALRVLTRYQRIDGIDMSKEALRPRRTGEKNLVGEVIDFAVQVANEHMVPEYMTPKLWEGLTGAERFYLKMMDIETTSLRKLDNYQNFAKAFRVNDYDKLMGPMEPNKARLKTAKEFKKNGFEIPEFGPSITRAALYGILELENDMEGDDVLSHLKDLLPNYHNKRDDLAAIAEYIARKREAVDETESRAARILHGLIRNERLG